MGAKVIPLDAGRRSTATKERILDAAEALFMEHGFEATSLRAITAAAGVNLAAVNYHFGSKEELFQAVLTRRLDPDEPGARRAARPARARGGARRAVVRPHPDGAVHPRAARSRAIRSAAARISCACSGRAYADPAPFIRQFLSEQYAVMIARFKDAFGRALPHLPRKELSWRLHFIMGALSYTLAGTDALKIIAELSPRETDNDEILLRRLAPFLLAGLNAPLPDLTEVDARVRRRARAQALTANSRKPSARRSASRNSRNMTMLTLLFLFVVAARRSRAGVCQRVGTRVGRRRAVALTASWLAHALPVALNLLLTVAFVALAIALAMPTLRRRLISDGVLARVPQADAADVADRTRGARGRHRVVGRRALLRPPGLAAAARRAAAGAHGRGAALPRRRGRDAVRA